jgi:hypothetical protein
MKYTGKKIILKGGTNMKKLICIYLMLAVIIITMPACATARKPRPETRGYTLEDVCDLAKNEGKVAASDKIFMWEMGGLFLPFIGTVLSLTVLPEIPKERLTDKAPKYVQEYTHCFQDEARSRQFSYSMLYFGPVLIIAAAIGALVIVANHH